MGTFTPETPRATHAGLFGLCMCTTMCITSLSNLVIRKNMRFAADALLLKLLVAYLLCFTSVKSIKVRHLYMQSFTEATTSK